MELRDFLVWLTTAGSGVAAFYIVANVMWFSTLTPERKRLAAFGVAAILAVLAWLAQVGLGYVATPATGVGWLEALFAVATGAFSLSQIIHGAQVLRQK